METLKVQIRASKGYPKEYHILGEYYINGISINHDFEGNDIFQSPNEYELWFFLKGELLFVCEDLCFEYPYKKDDKFEGRDTGSEGSNSEEDESLEDIEENDDKITKLGNRRKEREINIILSFESVEFLDDEYDVKFKSFNCEIFNGSPNARLLNIIPAYKIIAKDNFETYNTVTINADKLTPTQISQLKPKDEKIYSVYTSKNGSKHVVTVKRICNYSFVGEDIIKCKVVCRLKNINISKDGEKLLQLLFECKPKIDFEEPNGDYMYFLTDKNNPKRKYFMGSYYNFQIRKMEFWMNPKFIKSFLLKRGINNPILSADTEISGGPNINTKSNEISFNSKEECISFIDHIKKTHDKEIKYEIEEY